MITAEFEHHLPQNLSDLFALLRDNPEQAKVLGGGMTLVPMLNLGLTAPTMLIGLRNLTELNRLGEEAGHIVIGAMTRHFMIASDALIRQHAPVLRLAAGLIGDVQVRNRGTIGGSLAHADPAANYLPAVIVSDAVFELASPRGRRAVPAHEFFCDTMTTLLEDDEIVVSIQVPKAGAEAGFGFQKFTRVKGNFPIVCAAARLETANGPGRIVVGGVTPVPITVQVPEKACEDCGDLAALADTMRAAIVDPLEDQNGDAEYKREMAVLFGFRAFADAQRDSKIRASRHA